MRPLNDPSIHRAQHPAGFTLPEVLASGVLGAILLTALAYATTQAAMGITYMEQKAGIANSENIVLRRMTRDIREAYWAEVTSDTHLKLADPEGDITEYYLDQTDLMTLRPNGDEGVLLSNVDQLLFESASKELLREGESTDLTGAFYTRSVPSTPSFAFEIPQGGQVAMAFQAPTTDDELPGGGVATDEAILDMTATGISLPIAWVAGTDLESLTISLHESWAPGSFKPLGPALYSMTVSGDALPAAVWTGSGWSTPSSVVGLTLSGGSSNIEPGVGYTVLLHATGDAQIILTAHAEQLDSDRDDVGLALSASGSNFVNIQVAIPFSISGPHSITSSVPTDVVTVVSISLMVSNRPVQTRSAALLGQVVSKDPWGGVVPGEEAP
jgi:hypothetical protein